MEVQTTRQKSQMTYSQLKKLVQYFIYAKEKPQNFFENNNAQRTVLG